MTESDERGSSSHASNGNALGLPELQQPAPPSIPFDLMGLVLGPTVLVVWLLFVDTSQLAASYRLTPEAHRLAGIMLMTIIFWLTEPVPIAVTGMLAVALTVFLGAVPDAGGSFEPARDVLRAFADPSVYFLLGGMFIGRAMTRHGLDRRLALSILCTRWAARSPGALLAAVGLAVAVVSMWISNTAATAMIYPVTLGIVGTLAIGSGTNPQQFVRGPYASGLLLVTAYASSVGGIATPIGTATNVVAMGYFRRPEYLGQSVDFFRWCVVGLPMMVAIFLGMCVWLRFRSGSGTLDLPKLRGYLHEQRASLGRWSRGEANTLAVFLILVALWVTPGVLGILDEWQPDLARDWPGWERGLNKTFIRWFPEEIVALLAPILLCMLPVNLRSREFTLDGRDFWAIDWGTMLLFGAGISLGTLMRTTGLAVACGQALFDLLGTSDVWSITALAIGVGIMLSEFTSNVATVTTMIPVIWSLCQRAGVDPVPPLMGVTFGASFGSALPVSTPPNAIVYGSGLIPVRRMIAAGIGVDLVAGLVVWCVLRIAFGLGWSPVAS